MKTYSLVFGLLFAILGICATIGIAAGATHQIVMAVPSFIMAVVLLREASQKEKPKRIKSNK
ncbi:MAG: hypothetical protein M1292_00760 [Bacteroidetes bacterium]|nr:hypothetical protein [Bacteroidota bacterium]